MKERVLAIFGAVALIAAAFVVRSLIVGGDGGSGGVSESAGSGSSSERPVVACTKDLMAMCDALAAEGAIAPDPPTVELGSDGATTGTVDKVDLDGWITWDPAPALANFDARNKPAWDDEVLALSTDELAVIGPAETLAKLQQDCKGTWSCVAGSGLKVGVGQPSTDQGIARLTPLAMALTDTVDRDNLDANDLDISALNAFAGRGQVGLTAQLRALNQPGSWDLVVGPTELLDRATATQQGKQRQLEVATPGPSSTISVVLATRARSDRDLSGLLDDVRSDALSDTREAVGMSAAPGDTVNQNLAGFLYQVREKVG